MVVIQASEVYLPLLNKIITSSPLLVVTVFVNCSLRRLRLLLSATCGPAAEGFARVFIR